MTEETKSPKQIAADMGVKIYPSFWGVRKAKKSAVRTATPGKFKYEYKMDLLSYVTYTSGGKAFDKRKQTGLKWSEYTQPDCSLEESEMEFQFENEPVEGFAVMSVANRYSTSNKLIRILDPRGFIVESSVENFLITLDHSVVSNSFVMNKCRWGRRSSSFLLIPEGSPFDY